MTKSTGKKWIPGLSNFECQVCRGWYKSDEKKKRWDNLITCNRCWDPKPWFLYPIPKVTDLKPENNAIPHAPFTFQNSIVWNNLYIPLNMITATTWDNLK